MGFVAEPAIFSSRDMQTVPTATPSMVRYEPTPVMIKIPAPIRQAKVEVSPRLPGMLPQKADHQLAASMAPELTANWARRVAPVKLSSPLKSAAIQGASPLMAAG